MPTQPKPIKLKPRRCKYCRLEFVPACRNEQQRTNAEAQKFCSPAHRKAYHLNGGITFDRLVDKATRKIGEALMQDEKFIASLKTRLQAGPDYVHPSRII